MSDVTTDEYIANPEDEAIRAIYRLNAALALIQEAERRTDEHVEPDDDDGGYIARAAFDLVRSIRDDLRASVAKAEADRAEQKRRGAEGGAR
jgi:hypothetical protein